MITLYTFGPMFGLPDPSPFVMKALVMMKMSGLPFKTEAGPKALGKAPKGKLPFINDDGKLIADSTFIRFHLEDKHGVDLDKGLTPEQRGIGWAYEKMCEDHLYWAMIDSRWMIKENFEKGPRNFFNSAPALIRPLIIAKIHRDTKRAMWGHGMGRHTREEITTLAGRDLGAIAAQLGDKKFLFGDEPHAADATVFSFVNSALCPHFESGVRTAGSQHANLVAYTKRGTERWFPELAGA